MKNERERYAMTGCLVGDMKALIASSRHLPTLVRVSCCVGLTVALLPANEAAAGSPPCPARAGGDHEFRMADIGECIYVNTDHHRRPRLGAVIDYNIYCPGRIPTTGWESLGKKIAEGALIKDRDGRSVSPIVEQHRAAELGVKYIGMPHVFHYSCARLSTTCVATHIKVRVRSKRAGAPPVPNCTAVAQSGRIAPNVLMSREYKCVNPKFRSSHRGGWDSMVKRVAASLLRGADIQLAKLLKSKVCLLPSTDIQCAPCRHSDKLVVRVKTIPETHTCPRGSKEVR